MTTEDLPLGLAPDGRISSRTRTLPALASQLSAALMDLRFGRERRPGGCS
jgi:hypothetical protein